MDFTVTKQPVHHMYPTSDNTPVLPYHLHWLCYFTWTVSSSYPHLYHSFSRPKLTNSCSSEEEEDIYYIPLLRDSNYPKGTGRFLGYNTWISKGAFPVGPTSTNTLGALHVGIVGTSAAVPYWRGISVVNSSRWDKVSFWTHRKIGRHAIETPHFTQTKVTSICWKSSYQLCSLTLMDPCSWTSNHVLHSAHCYCKTFLKLCTKTSNKYPTAWLPTPHVAHTVQDQLNAQISCTQPGHITTWFSCLWTIKESLQRLYIHSGWQCAGDYGTVP